MNSVRMEINTTKAQLNITNKIRRFKMKRTPPKMEITRRTPTFKVNWAEVYAESGLKRPKQFMLDNRQKAYNKVLQAIKRTAQEGDMMMNIQPDAPDMIPVIAEQNMRAALPEVNIGSLPENFAEFTWDKGDFEISWTDGSVEIIWDEEFQPDINVTPHSVEIKIRNFQKVKMNDNRRKISGSTLDRKV